MASTLCTGIDRHRILADDGATLTSPGAPGMSPSHQKMKDTSLHAAASISPKLKDGIEASDDQHMKLLKNVTIEKDEEVSIVF